MGFERLRQVEQVEVKSLSVEAKEELYLEPILAYYLSYKL